jgi:hypothetical protein
MLPIIEDNLLETVNEHCTWFKSFPVSHCSGLTGELTWEPLGELASFISLPSL